jgi:hypothetical protein
MKGKLNPPPGDRLPHVVLRRKVKKATMSRRISMMADKSVPLKAAFSWELGTGGSPFTAAKFANVIKRRIVDAAVMTCGSTQRHEKRGIFLKRCKKKTLFNPAYRRDAPCRPKNAFGLHEGLSHLNNTMHGSVCLATLRGMGAQNLVTKFVDLAMPRKPDA